METSNVYTAVIAISDPGAAVAARQIVHKHGQFEIVREVPNAVMAVDSCRILRPDLLVLGDDSPGLRGSEVVGEIRHESPDTHIVMIATYDPKHLKSIPEVYLAVSLSDPDSLADALSAVATVKEHPEAVAAPERRRIDRRLKQDWSKVFAERRRDGRRDHGYDVDVDVD
ncbi:MAG: response regulator transcription factor [Acidimicrobiales bacterium]|nr:response regulator transcription factor [Acidimicrobiales bacterium]